MSCFWFVITQSNYDKQYFSYASELRVLTQQLAKRINQVTTLGDDETFATLKARQQEFAKIIDILKNGQEINGKVVLPKSPEHIQNGALLLVSSYWADINSHITFLLTHKSDIQSAIEINDSMHKNIRKLEVLYLEISSILVQKNAKPNLMHTITQQIIDAASISNDIRILLNITIPGTDVEKKFQDKIETFMRRANQLKFENTFSSLSPRFEEAERIAYDLQQKTDNIIKTALILDEVNRITVTISADNTKFLAATTQLADEYLEFPKTLFINSSLAIGCAVVSIILLLSLAFIVYQQQKINSELNEEINKKIQNDIQNLLTEISGLANGNLSVYVSSHGEIMKDIVVSINYAIDALRGLVVQINQASNEVSQMTRNAQGITKEVSNISETQEEKILEAARNLDLMVKLSEKVFFEANSSSAVALQSVNIANDGRSVVSNTILSMNRIQNQIRETSDKVVKLSKSSEEINEIIALISSITEQTNILSINASIQAAMAGDQGQGFAVIADEIQKLSTKAGLSTNQIVHLIKSIQQDTQEVIDAMINTRTEVRLGGESTQLAGQTLEKIESVSKDLSQHIKLISQASDEQKNMSVIVSEKMKDVKDLSALTASKASATESLIGSLSKLIGELRNSVSKFKLTQ